MYATKGGGPPMRRLTPQQNRDNKIYAILLTALALISFVVILVRARDLMIEDQVDVPEVAKPKINFPAPPKGNPVHDNIVPVVHVNNDVNDDNDDDDDEEGINNEDNPTKKRGLDSVDERKAAVKAAMKHAWNGYKKYAWGSDNLMPISNKGSNSFEIGATIIESLDTLWIMDMKDEFYEGRDWVKYNFNPNVDKYVSFSETTTSILGGLLSAYTLSEDSVFIDKARALGDNLIRAFDTDNSLPHPRINLKTGSWSELDNNITLREIGTIQLEFLYLSEITGDDSYGEKVLDILDTIWEKNKEFNGLIPTCLDLKNGGKCDGPVKFGNDGNGYYDYLLKLYFFLGGKLNPEARVYRSMFDASMRPFVNEMIETSSPSDLMYVARLENGKVVHKMKQSACVIGGMFTLAGAKAYEDKYSEYINNGESITSTCHEFYSRMASGLAPEAVKFVGENDFRATVKYNLLRMETVQSYFINWRLTHDEKYLDWGWEMFQAIESKCRTDSGYAILDDVTKNNPVKIDSMPSHLLGGTLKYLYLMYSEDDVISLDDYVFNSGAHLFPVDKNDNHVQDIDVRRNRIWKNYK